MQDFTDKIAVVTGGANGIGKGIGIALLEQGAQLVIADIEGDVIDQAVSELGDRFDPSKVWGHTTDVSDRSSTDALADAVYERHGACHLLFNNAGVTSGGGGKPWEQELNDFKWCFGVNVFGMANGCGSFVARMIEGGQQGRIINTSSGDGGFAPVPRASVYAASKAAVSCFTEALAHNLINEGTELRASVFYPSGGLLDTGLFTASRNRPAELQREGAATGRRSMTFPEIKAMLEKAGNDVQVADLEELGRFVLDGIANDHYIIGHGLDETATLLHARADAIERAELPPCHELGI